MAQAMYKSQLERCDQASAARFRFPPEMVPPKLLAVKFPSTVGQVAQVAEYLLLAG
jgi:hypothetical protein